MDQKHIESIQEPAPFWQRARIIGPDTYLGYFKEKTKQPGCALWVEAEPPQEGVLERKDGPEEDILCYRSNFWCEGRNMVILHKNVELLSDILPIEHVDTVDITKADVTAWRERYPEGKEETL